MYLVVFPTYTTLLHCWICLPVDAMFVTALSIFGIDKSLAETDSELVTRLLLFSTEE